MRLLWTKTSTGIGLLLAALGVILTDRRNEVEYTAGQIPTGHLR